MKAPVTHNASQRYLQRIEQRTLFRLHGNPAARGQSTLLETYKEDMKRDKSIVRETDCIEELNFSEPNYSDLKCWFLQLKQA